MMQRTGIEQAIEKYGFLVHTFSGVSMMPMLNQKQDAVRLVKPKRPLKRYDIVLYGREDGAVVLHRIIRVKKDGYLIRGDNCLWNEWVRAEQMIALAEGIYKNGDYLACEERQMKWYALRQGLTLPWRRLRWRLGCIFRLLKRRMDRCRGKEGKYEQTGG